MYFLVIKLQLTLNSCASEFLIGTCEVQLAETFIYAVLIIVTRGLVWRSG